MLSMGEPKRGGRQSLEPGSPSLTIPVRLGPSLHDKACRIALRLGISVSEVQRRALEQYEPEDDEDYY